MPPVATRQTELRLPGGYGWHSGAPGYPTGGLSRRGGVVGDHAVRNGDLLGIWEGHPGRVPFRKGNHVL